MLTADSSAPLNDGLGNTISFTEIGGNGTGIMPSGTFNGTPNQLMFTTTQSWVQGTTAFYYANTTYVSSGIYIGRVTFTLSSP